MWVRELVDYLPVLAPDLNFLFMRHPRGPKRLSTAPNTRECTVPQEANGPATMFWLSHIVDLRDVDIYHNTFNMMPYGIRIPAVVSVTDIMQIKHPAWAKGPGLLEWVNVGFKWHGLWRALSHATLIVAVSEATRDEIASVDPVAARKTRVAFQGVSGDFHVLEGAEGAARVESARRRHVAGARRYILTVGQFSAYKNHEMILRAFARAFASDPGMHLLLVQRVGPGPRVLRPIAKALGVGDRVHFSRDLPLADLVALYNGAVALAHPSLYEGYGNPVIEALACGCPVVTSNRSSMPEVAAGAALLVDPERLDEIANAMWSLATDIALASELRRRGLARAQGLSWRSFAEKHVDAYREVLALRR